MTGRRRRVQIENKLASNDAILGRIRAGVVRVRAASQHHAIPKNNDAGGRPIHSIESRRSDHIKSVFHFQSATPEPSSPDRHNRRMGCCNDRSTWGLARSGRPARPRKSLPTTNVFETAAASCPPRGGGRRENLVAPLYRAGGLRQDHVRALLVGSLRDGGQSQRQGTPLARSDRCRAWNSSDAHPGDNSFWVNAKDQLSLSLLAFPRYASAQVNGEGGRGSIGAPFYGYVRAGRGRLLVS